MKYILEEFNVFFRFALFAVVIALGRQGFGRETHAETMLPDFAHFALYHELARVRIFIAYRRFQ